MTPITFQGKRYYMVNNGELAEDASCNGCVFAELDSDDCPNGYLGSPKRNQCNVDNRIYIKRTQKAVAEWTAWRLEGFPDKEAAQ